MTPQAPTTTLEDDPEAAVSANPGDEESSLPEDCHGSSVAGAAFNFTNSIVGAGAIGLGGAIAISGGAISVALILFFGILTKLSLDLVIRLSVETEGAHGSYEDLAKVALGIPGKGVVMACKFMYSFGCLVAYIVVLKDNFGPALSNLIYGEASSANTWLRQLLSESAYFTWIVSLVCILPLCLLRDMTPLASFSVVSVVSMVSIMAIVIYIYFACPDIAQPGGSFYENWLEIRPGVLER
jgi:sodium-coupled neutral amino acid transporter 11